MLAERNAVPHDDCDPAVICHEPRTCLDHEIATAVSVTQAEGLASGYQESPQAPSQARWQVGEDLRGKKTRVTKRTARDQKRRRFSGKQSILQFSLIYLSSPCQKISNPLCVCVEKWERAQSQTGWGRWGRG